MNSLKSDGHYARKLSPPLDRCLLGAAALTLSFVYATANAATPVNFHRVPSGQMPNCDDKKTGVNDQCLDPLRYVSGNGNAALSNIAVGIYNPVPGQVFSSVEVYWSCDGVFRGVQGNSISSGQLFPVMYGTCTKRPIDDRTQPRSCEPEAGNPIRPMQGTKVERITLLEGRFPLVLTFDSSPLRKVDLFSYGQPLGGINMGVSKPAPGLVAPLWGLSFFRASYPKSEIRNAEDFLDMGDGRMLPANSGTHFERPSFVSSIKNGKNVTFLYDPHAGEQSLFSEGAEATSLAPNGLLEVIRQKRDGTSIRFESSADETFAGGMKTVVTGDDGRALVIYFSAVGNSGRRTMRAIDDWAGQRIAIEHDLQGRLESIRWQDGELRRFLYTDARFPTALTGVVDESDRRFSTFVYGEGGDVISTERAGGVGRHVIEYASPPAIKYDISPPSDPDGGGTLLLELGSSATTKKPNGEISPLTFRTIGGTPQMVSQGQAAGSGCESAVANQDFDDLGRRLWQEDFKGNKTCYAYYDYNEIMRLEGAPAGTDCSVLSAAPSLPQPVRKTSTKWHPHWKLKTGVAEPGRTTYYVYNGQPDPTNDSQITSCAPATAKMIDQDSIAVLCKKVELATNNVDGYYGFYAEIDASVPARVDRWTYDESGRVLSHDGPLVGLSDVTNYEYYETAGIHWAKGDLRLVRNAANHTVSYTKYNKGGKPLQMVDANGVVTDYTYDLRQRLKTVTVAGETTSYEYFPTGLLKQITQPDSSFVAYEYDDAHRQIAVRDHLGNRIDYVLDNMGNRTAEQFKDPGGALRRSVTRVFDALGRVEQTTGRE